MKINAKPLPPVCRSLLLLHHSATHTHAHTQAHQRRRSARARQPVRPSVLRVVSRLARCSHTQTMVNEPALAAAFKATQLRGWIEPDRAAAALIHTHRFQTRAKCVLCGPLPALSPNSRTCGLFCRYAGTTCVCSHLSVRYSPYATSRCR